FADHSVRANAPKECRGDPERRHPRCHGDRRPPLRAAAELGRQADGCQRHRRTPEKGFVPVALDSGFLYNNVTKKRGYTVVPMKIAGWPFHIWQSLVEKAGFKISDIPNRWDAFLDFFMPVQDALRKQGMRNVYAYGYQLTANGVDPISTYDHFLIAY